MEDHDLIKDTQNKLWSMVAGSGLFGLISSFLNASPFDPRLMALTFLSATISGVFGVIISRNRYIKYQTNEYELVIEYRQGTKGYFWIIFAISLMLIFAVYKTSGSALFLNIFFLGLLCFLFFFVVTDYVMHDSTSRLRQNTLRNMTRKRLQELVTIWKDKKRTKRELDNAIASAEETIKEVDEAMDAVLNDEKIDVNKYRWLKESLTPDEIKKFS